MLQEIKLFDAPLREFPLLRNFPKRVDYQHALTSEKRLAQVIVSEDFTDQDSVIDAE